MGASVNGKALTPEDDAALRQLIGHQPYATIGAVLGRSAGSVHGMAKLLGITPGPRRGAARIEFLARKARMIRGYKDEASHQISELTELIQSDREECQPDDLRRAIDESQGVTVK